MIAAVIVHQLFSSVIVPNCFLSDRKESLPDGHQATAATDASLSDDIKKNKRKVAGQEMTLHL